MSCQVREVILLKRIAQEEFKRRRTMSQTLKVSYCSRSKNRVL